MQFGSFIWPNDPEHLRCSYRRMATQEDGDGGWSLIDRGYGGCTIVAEGDFYTAGSAAALTELFRTGGAMALKVPGVGQFSARCTALVLEQEAVADCIHYIATFQEAPA